MQSDQLTSENTVPLLQPTRHHAAASPPSPSDHLRVLLSTTESHPTWRADVRVLFGKFLPQFGVRVDLMAIVHEWPPVEWLGGRLIVARAKGGLTSLLRSALLQLRLFRVAAKDYDVLIVRDQPITGIIGFLAARWAGIPFAYWMSFPLPEANLRLSKRPDVSPPRRVYLWLRGRIGSLVLYRWLLPRSDWIFAQSDVMVDELNAKSVRHGRISSVPMGVDIGAIAPPLKVPPPELVGRRVAVYLGTLDRYRQPEVMIDIALDVARAFPNFTLLVIGDADEPNDRGWLARQARERGAAAHMHFTGRLPFDQAQALMQCAEVGLSPFPRSELLESASPTKAVEYLAAGLPVICNDQPDQAKVIWESGGGWCVPLTAEAFAAAIVECLTDPLRSQQKAERGRAYVGKHRSYRQLARTVALQLKEIAKANIKDHES